MRTLNTRFALCAMLLVATAPGASSQNAETYVARLSFAPIEAETVAEIAGSGRATAVLTGRALTVSGTYEGLRHPAVAAALHAAPKGLRGPVIAALTVTGNTAGTIRGEVILTPTEVEHLRQERLYVQIQGDETPDGSLRGWLLPRRSE